MPFDSTPTAEPSFTELARILRHKEEWPEGFEWDYRYGRSCAIGLADRLWGPQRRFRIPAEIYAGVYCPQRWYGWLCPPTAQPKPEWVADAIDRYIARNPIDRVSGI